MNSYNYKKVLFAESQKLKQWWVWALLILINILFIGGCIAQIGFGKQFGNNPLSNTGLVIITVVILLFSMIFFIARFETKITVDGIYVRLVPFSKKYKFYPWEKLNNYYVRKYVPMKEYGGWGIRHKENEKDSAYTVSGDKGLQLEFKNNKKLLIGTNKEAELKEALSKVEKLRNGQM